MRSEVIPKHAFAGSVITVYLGIDNLPIFPLLCSGTGVSTIVSGGFGDTALAVDPS